MEFKDVFTPPFSLDYPMVFDAKNRISLTATCNEPIAIKFIDKLNGDIDKKLKDAYVTYEKGEINYFNSKNCGAVKIMLVRGWGRLTGIGGLNMDGDEAAKLQDDFGNYIVSILNK